MIRQVLAEVGRLVDSLVAPSPQVQFGVAGAVEEQEERETEEMASFFGGRVWTVEGCVPRDPRCPSLCTSCARVSAAADAAETGPEAVSTVPPAVPASGQPDTYDLADHVAEYIWEHRVYSMARSAGSGPIDRILCNGCPGGFYRSLDEHASHVRSGARALISDTARMAAATNKFRHPEQPPDTSWIEHEVGIRKNKREP